MIKNIIKNRTSFAVIFSASFALYSCGVDSNQSKAKTEDVKKMLASESKLWPAIQSNIPKDPLVESKISQILKTMTLEQKIAQMIQPEIGDFTVEDMRRYGFGSYLNGGGSFPNREKHSTPGDWVDYAEAMYQASIDDSIDGSKIPTMWGTDAVHGHNNVIGATLFPHNIGLGATRNPQLIKEIARATAKEVMVTGIDWVFAPTVAVARDDRWGRTYESYSEDPQIVKQYSQAIVEGLQGIPGSNLFGDDSVISTVKHFIGDGGTTKGDDQGNTEISERELFEIHAQGYIGGLEAGAQSVMASFNSWNGKKNHGSHYLLTEVLKNKMAFDGFVVGDWNGHGQVEGCSNVSCPQSINAGLDIFMVPTKAWKPLMENTIQQVTNGEISIERINDAVSRILRVKLRSGLFEKPSPANRPLSAKTKWIGHESHREIARRAVRESLVLLKNQGQLLPLDSTKRYLVTGDGAHNIGKQSGGWSITWQGTGNENQDFPGATSIYDGIKNRVESSGGEVELSKHGDFTQKPDVAIIVFGENPYAEGNGDLDNLEYQRGQKKDLMLLSKLRAQKIPVVSIFISGRPLWVNAELNASDAFVAAWLPGTEGGGIAEVLFKSSTGESGYDFVGKLPFSWPNGPTQMADSRSKENSLFPLGFGLGYGESDLTQYPLSEESENVLNDLGSINLLSFPWRPSVVFGKKLQLIQSSHFDNDFIKYQTTDRRIQEDAREIEFYGIQESAFDINDNFPFDLRGYFEAESTISFDFKVNIPPTDSVVLTMRCEDKCDPEVEITDKLTLEDDWRNLSIDLACFANDNIQMHKVVSPFIIKTKGKLSLTLSDIKIIPKSKENASIKCEKK